MEAHGGRGGIAPTHTGWGWVVSVTPRPPFTPRERTPGTHWIGGWVGPKAGLDAGARGKILWPCRGSNPDRPARSHTLYCLSYRGSPNSKQYFVKNIPHRSVFQTQVSDINGLFVLYNAPNVYCDQLLSLSRIEILLENQVLWITGPLVLPDN
jgi:hypothetical protein